MEKKTKLTISGIPKKSIENIKIAKTQSKNSVVIEKKTNKFTGKSSFNKNLNTQRLKKNQSFLHSSVFCFQTQVLFHFVIKLSKYGRKT